MLLFRFPDVLWPTPGLPGLLAARARSSVTLAFANFNFPWLVGIVGLIFAPWTALMYVLIFPLNGFDWIWLGFGLACDIAGYVGGYHNRKQVRCTRIPHHKLLASVTMLNLAVYG